MEKYKEYMAGKTDMHHCNYNNAVS